MSRTRKYRTPTYITWEGMRYRCYSVTNISYENYGGRGIKVCDRWQDYSNFLEDMGEKPAGMSLDRIDNNLDYSPENCRWTDWTTQNNNRSNNKRFGEKQLTLTQWSNELGIPRTTIMSRMRRGLTFDQAIL